MESDQFNQTRHDVLSRLRERWGSSRKTDPEQQSSDRIHQFESFLMPYLELAEVEEALAAPPLEPGNPQIRTMAENFRKIKKEKPHPLEEPIPKPGEGGGAASGTKRRELMLEIASAHFRSSMGSWMSSVAADHEVTTTPIEDLERMHEEAAYRLKVINTILAMTEKEVDAIESQIKARKIQAERALEAQSPAASTNGAVEKPAEVVPPAETPKVESARKTAKLVLPKLEVPKVELPKVEPKAPTPPAAAPKAKVPAEKPPAAESKAKPPKTVVKNPKTVVADKKTASGSSRTVAPNSKVVAKSAKPAARSSKPKAAPAKPKPVAPTAKAASKAKAAIPKTKPKAAKPKR